MKYENLKNLELVNYIRDKEEFLPIEINENYYCKLPVSEDILFIMKVLNSYSSFTGNLVLCINTKKECVLQVFPMGLELLKNSEVEDFNNLKLLQDFNNALKEEFLAVIENLEFDEILLKDTEVIERAEEQGYEKLKYEIPEIKSFTSLNLFNIGEILNDVHDAAYLYLENYLAKNPAYLRECQRIFAINKLIEENKSSLGFVEVTGMEEAKEEIFKIFKKPMYKSVRITLETNAGEEYTESIKVKRDVIDSLPPIYAIKKITWRTNVLYERPSNESLVEMYKENLEENLDFLDRIHFYKRTFTLPEDSFFVKSLFKNPVFMVKYYGFCKDKDNYLSMLDESLLDNLDFALDLIKHMGMFTSVKLESIYELFSKLQNEEQFCVALLNKNYGNRLYSHLTAKMKQNKRVLETFIEETAKALSPEYREVYNNLTSDVLDSDDLVNYVETLLLPHSPATYHLDVAKQHKNKKFLYRICIFENKIPKEFQDGTISIVDDNFMRGLIEESNSSYPFILDKLETSFKHLLKEEEIQKKIISNISSSYLERLKDLLLIEPNLLSLDNMNFVFSTNTYKAEMLIPYCSPTVQLELLKTNNYCLTKIFNLQTGYRMVSLKHITDKILEVLDGLYALDDISYFEPFQWMVFDDDTITFLIKRYPKTCEHLGKHQKHIFENLQKEVFLLPYIKTSDWNTSQLLNDKNYIREQAKLNPLVLHCLNTPRKNSSLISLHSDRDFVLEMIHLEPKNIYGLWKKSPFFDDISFAKEVLALIPEAKKLFTKRVQKEID